MIPTLFLIRYHISMSTTLLISVLHLQHLHLLILELLRPSQLQTFLTLILPIIPYHSLLAFLSTPPQVSTLSPSSLESYPAQIQTSSSAQSTVPAPSLSPMSVVMTVLSSMPPLHSTSSQDTKSKRSSAAIVASSNPQTEMYKKARSVDSSPQILWHS